MSFDEVRGAADQEFNLTIDTEGTLEYATK